MGIVPGEYSTGGRQKLLGISKRGKKYLRRLFVQGARSVLRQRHKQAPGLSRWLAQLLGRTEQNVVVVLRPTSWFACPGRSYVRTNAIALPFLR
jgi:transposase